MFLIRDLWRQVYRFNYWFYITFNLKPTEATSRLRKIGVVLPDVLTTNVVIVTIFIYFFEYSQENQCKVMLTWKLVYGKERNIGSFSLIRMIWIVFLTRVQLKKKVVGKTDCVMFVTLCTFNALLTLLSQLFMITFITLPCSCILIYTW